MSEDAPEHAEGEARVARERVRRALAKPFTQPSAGGTSPVEAPRRSRPSPTVQAPGDKPISFNAAMARALIAGQKLQTRRPIRPLPAGEVLLDGEPWPVDHRGERIACRLATPGDALWVREPWQFDPGGRAREYEADLGAAAAARKRWRPGRSLPRDGARMTLRVDRVWPHRLSAITPDEARSEGMPPGLFDDAPEVWFQRLWDGIYGRGEFAWANDPWVWAIAFTPIELPGERPRLTKQRRPASM